MEDPDPDPSGPVSGRVFEPAAAKDVRQPSGFRKSWHPKNHFFSDGLVEVGGKSVALGLPALDAIAKADWLHKAVRKLPVGQQRTEKS